METHKYNYGIIGNCAYLALIDDKANVGWMCWPKFDSSFIFGTLLDDEKGGNFSVQPEWDTYTSSQKYIYNTNVLETTFECEDGSFKVVDFAPRFFQNERVYKPLMFFRKLVPISGNPRIVVSCNPRGNYGEIIPTKVFGSSHIRYEGLKQKVRLTTDIPLNFIETEQAFVLNKSRYLVLTYGVPLEGPLKSSADIFLDKTIKYWHKWVLNTSTEKFHQDAVIRSALTLKLHQYQDTGAIIAAATTSLPEFPGSTRNWDYRYCWIRDAHYTLKALNDLSHFSILEKYAGYIQNIALNEQGRIRPLFKIAIDSDPVEKILPLKGYRGERPVRVGNQAYEHVQNDVYGQVLVTLLPLFVDKRLLSNDQSGLKDLVMHCLRMIEETMEEPDNGLWEFRGTSQLHCYTFLFHWAGSHAGVKIAKMLGDKDMQQLAEQLIEESAEMIERCYDEERGVYTQAAGVPNLDASLLQLINMGYLDPKSEKAKKHLDVLEKALRTESGLFYRYLHEDDFGKPESTFLICAFWYVETLARMDRLDEAIKIFETLLEKGTNHLGLLSEDVHEESGSQWGNFPQLYSHVGLINAAFTISKKLDKPLFLDLN
jgi:GH15 family glucan-1,4-alpha-glucosidase